MSVLLIDIGNTRGKWRLRHQEMTHRGSFNLSDDGDCWFQSLPCPPEKIDQCIISSVVVNPDLKQALNRFWGACVRWVEQPGQADFFHHCYSDPGRLGVDRWLAMIGARHQQSGNLLVLDAGTAFKLDLLDHQNAHLGGFILPGLQMSRQALWSNTDRVIGYSDEAQTTDLSPGQHTVACVNAGVRRQMLALAKDVLADYPDFHPLVTGGDGKWIAEHLALPYFPELIFDGLEHLLCAGYFSH